MGLLDRIAAARTPEKTEQRYSADTWLSEYLLPTGGIVSYQGTPYSFGYPKVAQTWDLNGRVQELSATLPAYSAALRRCAPAFAAQMVRALVLSQARFTFRNPPWHPVTPRRMFGNSALATLEKPWPNATTGQMVSVAEWHAGLAGNAYIVRQPTRLRVLRPDWTAIIYGSQQEPEEAAHALDGELVGYAYCNGGIAAASRNQIHTLLPDEVAHWSPIPDPECAGIGMSWVTPAVREIQGDTAATEHKLRFFTNGATPNMVVKGIPAATKEEFDAIVDMLEEAHTGVANAYRTLYLTAGADATVVGTDMQKLDFKNVQGGGETRIAMLSRVHPTILAAAEGLAGSSLNAGNFGMARRIWADTWVYPTLQDLAATLGTIIDVPPDAELWFDTGDMPILREDAKDAAEIEQIRASTIEMHVRSGFKPDSAVKAVRGQDVGLLEHTGLQSVQMQAPAPDAGIAQVMYTKAQAADALVKAGFDPMSVVAALGAYDTGLLESGPLVPRQLIEDPAVVGAEPGVQQIPGGQGEPAPAVPPAPVPRPPARGRGR